MDFDVPIREANDDYDSLLWLLGTGDFELEDIQALDFEIMAVQSIIYIEEFIKEPSNLDNFTGAFFAFRESEKLINELETKDEILSVEYKTKKEIIQKATVASRY